MVLEVLLRALSRDLQLKTIWEESFLLDRIKPAVYDEEPDLFIVKLVIVIIKIGMTIHSILMLLFIELFAKALIAWV